MSYTKLRQTLADVLETAYQVPEDDIATLLPEDEASFKENEFKSSFLDLDKTRIQTIKQTGKDKFEQGYSKAKKEERAAFEKEIKEQFSIDDDSLMGIDLVKKVAEINAKTTKADASKLTEDEIKTHPSVIKMLNDRDKAFKDQEKALKEDYDTKISQFSKKEVFTKVSKTALSILDEMNPVLSTDPIKANNQKNWLLKELEGLDFQESDNDFIPLKEGKRLENDHGHGVSLKQFVQDKAKGLYDFKQADPRENPDPADGGGGGAGKAPKTEAEYAKMVTDTNIPLAERIKIKEDWNKQPAS